MAGLIPGVPAGVGGWEAGRRCGEGRLEENVFVICWGWGERGRKNLSRFLATDLGMRLGGLDPKKQKKGCGSVVSKLSCSGKNSPWELSVGPCWGWGLGQSKELGDRG